MNPLALIPLGSAVALGFLGGMIAAIRPRDRAARAFLGFCAVVAAASFAEFQLQSFGTTHEAGELWLRVRGVWPLAFALLLQFMLAETGAWRRRRVWLYPLLYIPAFAAVALNILTDYVVTGIVASRWGWSPVRAYSSLHYLVLFWAAVVGAITLLVGLRYWWSARGLLKRRQARQIAMGVLAPVLLTLAIDGLLVISKVDLPRVSMLGALLAAVLISRAIRRTSLFVVSPAAAADIIIASMSDLLFLTDAEGKILRTNRAALQMLALREEDVLGQPVEQILSPVSLSMTDSVKEMEARVVTRDKRSLILSLSTSRIQDQQGRPVGMTLIGRDISDRKRVEEARESLVRSMIKAQDEERRRIARELHDETGQVLGSLIAELRVLEDQVRGDEVQRRVSDLRHLVTMALQEIQRISRGMHPGILDALGLAAALQHYASEFARLHEIQVTTEILGIEEKGSLPPELETTLYRVVQEAFTNVARHADARVVSLFVVRQGPLLRAIIEDDGKGFDPNRTGPVYGLGLLGIEERVKLLGGSLRLETAPGEGVTLKVELPVRAHPP